MAPSRSRSAPDAKHISSASALTSHGCPRVCSHTAATASGANSWPVSAVCWQSSASTSERAKSPIRSDLALMLKALPPVTTSFSELAWIR